MKKINFKKWWKIVLLFILLFILWTVLNLFRQWENPFLIGKYFLFESQDSYQVDRDLKRRHDDKDFWEISNGAHEMKRLLEKYRNEKSYNFKEKEIMWNAGNIFKCINWEKEECRFNKYDSKGKSEYYTLNMKEWLEYFENEWRMLVLKEIFEKYLNLLDDFSKYDHISICDWESRKCDYRIKLWYDPVFGSNNHLYAYLLLVESEEERFQLYEKLYTKILGHLALTSWDFIHSYAKWTLLDIFEDHLYEKTSEIYKSKYAKLFRSTKYNPKEEFANTVKQQNVRLHYDLNFPEENMKKSIYMYWSIFSRALNDVTRELLENWECSEDIYEKYKGSVLVSWAILDSNCVRFEWLMKRLIAREEKRVNIIEMLSE